MLLTGVDGLLRPPCAGSPLLSERTPRGVSALQRLCLQHTRGRAANPSRRVLPRRRDQAETQPRPPPSGDAGPLEMWRRTGGRRRETPCRSRRVSTAPPCGFRAGRASQAPPARLAPPRPPVDRSASPPLPLDAPRRLRRGSRARYLSWLRAAGGAGRTRRGRTRRSNSENNGATVQSGAPRSSERPPPSVVLTHPGCPAVPPHGKE